MILVMRSFYVRLFGTDSPGRALPVSFDAALAALDQLPHMFTEPDGSFVGRSPPDVAPPWQVEGTLVDGGEALLYVELKGCCPTPVWNQLLACFTQGETRFEVESVLAGRTLSEAEIADLHWP